MGKTYTGIDIGSSTLKMAVCDGGSIRKIVLEELPEGLMSEGRITSLEAMADFIKAAAKRSGGMTKHAAFVIPQADCVTRRIQVPAMSVRDLEINLPYEFRDYITQGKDKFFYDYAVVGTKTLPDGTPEVMDLLAVAASKQVIGEYARMFSRAGMKLAVALPTAAALQNLVRGNASARANCCIIDFSHATTQLHFFADGAYDVSRVIEIGMVDFDRALGDLHGLDAHAASGYRQAGLRDEKDVEAIRGVCESIAVEVGRALNFYGFNNPETTIDTVYTCGGGSMVEPLVAKVAEYIDLEQRSIAEIMPPAAENVALACRCPAAVGATMGGGR